MNLSSGENGSDLIGNGSGNSSMYCGEKWREFWSDYDQNWNEQILLSISILGVIVNSLNIVVFTRKGMRNPTISLLTALALSDLLFVLTKLQWMVFNWNYGVQPEDEQLFPLAVVQLTNACLLALFHCTSCHLTVAIAIWRYCMVLKPLKSRSWATLRNARWITSFIFFMGLAISLGSFLSAISIGQSNGKDSGGVIRRRVGGENDELYALLQNEGGAKYGLFIYGILIKLLPCFILLFVSLGLIRSLWNARKTRKLLTSKTRKILAENSMKAGDSSSFSFSSISSSGLSSAYMNPRDNVSHINGKFPEPGKTFPTISSDFDRTTWMLLLVLLIFLITEFPAGIAGIVAGTFYANKDFFEQCYVPCVRIFFMCEFISTASSFFIYVSTGLKFRRTLIDLLSAAWRKRNPFRQSSRQSRKSFNLNKK